MATSGLNPVRCLLARLFMSEKSLTLSLTILLWAISLIVIYFACMESIF